MRAHSQADSFDIVVLGGSYVGLAVGRALALALRHEVRIAILDRRRLDDAPSHDPRAYAISAGSKHMLDALGVWQELVAHAQPVEAIDITDSALQHAIRPILLSWDNTIEGSEPASWIVEGARLRSALLAVARNTPNLEVRAPLEALGSTVDDTGIEVALVNGELIRASLVIAADGRDSPARDAAGIKLVRWVQPQIGIVTTVALERPHRARAVQHFLPSGPFAILPLRDNRACVTWSEDKERGRAIVALPDAAFLVELQQRFGYRLGTIALAGPRASWPLQFHMARTMTARRLALAGDSARGVHPIAGQGLNLGFKDVAALTQCVAEAMRLGLDPGSSIALERYERWRRFDSVQAAAAFEALNRLFSNDSGLVRAVRDVGLGLVNRAPALKQALVGEAAGLTGEVPRLLRGEMA